MESCSPVLVNADWNAFDPWRVQAVTHGLADHPLLQIPALIELGKRLESRGSIRTHSSTATAGTAFNYAPNLHPNQRGAVATMTDLEHAQAWMSLLNVQTDPAYRALVDEVLDPWRPFIGSRDPGMCYRAGWIFVSSPGAVTPFHMDKEHNFILQMRGSKTHLRVGAGRSEVVSEHARDRFHRSHSRDSGPVAGGVPRRARMNSICSPAWVPTCLRPARTWSRTAPEPSVTMSFTYYTRSTRRNALLHRVHDQARGLGIVPPAVGRYPWMDAATHAAASLYAGSKRAVRRLAGRVATTDSVPYAIPKSA